MRNLNSNELQHVYGGDSGKKDHKSKSKSYSKSYSKSKSKSKSYSYGKGDRY